MENKNKRSSIKKPILLITYTILLFVLVYRIDSVWNGVRWVTGALSPLFLGFSMAYLFHIPMNFFQYKVLSSWQHNVSPILRRLWRGMSMLLAYLSVIAVLVGLVALVFPRAVESVGTLLSNFSSYLMRFQSWADGFLTSLSIDADAYDIFTNLWSQAVGMLQTLLGSIINQAVNITVGFTNGITNFILALMFSGFLLYNRAAIISQVRRLGMVVIGEKRVLRFAEIAHLGDNIFSRFVMGKILDSLVLGVMTFLGMQLFGMEYALLISTIIAATALVPIIGPIVGTVVCALLLLMVNPQRAVGFIILVIIIQQIEGNAIYPKLMGNATGLSSFWVMVSIIIGGGLFGVWGMLLGTPLFAVCFHLVARWLDTRNTIS